AAPTLLELDGIRLGQMRFRIALHVNNAQLNVGGWEQTRRDWRQTAKVIVNDNHDATKATFNQPAQNQLPVFEIFATWSGDTSENLFFAVATQANDDVDTCRTQFVTIPEFNVFAIQKKSQHIGMDGTAVA